MYNYNVYNSNTARVAYIKAPNLKDARKKGEKIIGTKKGIVRAFRNY